MMTNKDNRTLNVVQDDVKVLKQQIKVLKRLVYELMDEVRGRD